MNYEQLLNKTVQEMPFSGIRKFFDIVAEMKDAVSLGVGEPDFTTPWNACRAAIRSIEAGETHYVSNWGTIELRRLIARYQSERFQTTYDPKSEIFVTIGASEGIDLAMRTLITPGDEVLVPAPSYVSYQPAVSLAGGVPVVLDCDEKSGFRVRAQTLRERITPRTRALILPYPNTPTGAILELQDLKAIAEVLRGTDVFIIADEVYAELTYGGRKHVSIASLPGMWERTVLLNGFSKAFAMTGWRLGYVCAPAPIASLMLKIHQYVIMCAPTVSQAAACAALRDGFEDGFSAVHKMTAEYDQRRRLLVKGFRDMGLPCFEPLGAFYVFPNVSKAGLSSTEFCERLLMEQKLAVVPGTAFGASGEGFVRCSYATSMQNLQEALVRMRAFLASRNLLP